ncbi:MAG: universal stress protein [Campylobacterales bacterium]|nr:universal stress protein [Campylobacterales bacterium]
MGGKEQYIYACIDGSKFSRYVFEYGVDLSKNLNLPLKLLNFIENDKLEKIASNKELLNEFERIAKNRKIENVTTIQTKGTLQEGLLDIQESIRVAIIGLKGLSNERKNTIGSQVEKIIKDVAAPILLVNGNYRPISKVLIAYDGSTSSQKALDMLISAPIFQDIQRDIVSVNNEAILNEAKKKLANSNIDANFIYLEGEPVSAILTHQKVCNIDLISMGAFGHGVLHHIIYGSVTHHMLLEACVPLLLVRQQNT